MTRRAPEVRGKRRCTGHCCERIVIGGTGARGLTYILKNVRFYSWAHRPYHKGKWKAREIAQGLRDNVRMLRMLIPLGGGRFACRHFDTKTRNCVIYEKRPWMCAAYPYGRPCTLKGCTLEV